jgi:membrane-associated phospholipid phosphatase
MEFLLELDYRVFEFINQGLSNDFFNFFLKWMRNEWIWAPLYVFIISFCIYNFGKKAYWLVLFLLLTVSISDTVSSRLIKKTVKRERPCRNEAIENPNVLIKCGKGFSFTSSHATNHFAIASFLVFTLGQFYKKIKWPLLIWAFLIGFSQIYVGVHFPLDVLAGSIVGYCIGRLAALLFNKQYGYTLTV